MANIGPLGRPFPPVYDAVDRYAWKEDSEFQSGLASILFSDVPAEQAEEMKIKAQCFYFERKFDVPIDVDEYKAWKVYKANRSTVNDVAAAPKAAPEPSSSSFSEILAASDAPASPEGEVQAAASAASGPQYPPSFAQVVELISTGKPIPGIKQIPPTVLEGQGSESTKPQRRKPWEKDDTSATTSDSVPSAVAT